MSHLVFFFVMRQTYVCQLLVEYICANCQQIAYVMPTEKCKAIAACLVTHCNKWSVTPCVFQKYFIPTVKITYCYEIMKYKVFASVHSSIYPFVRQFVCSSLRPSVHLSIHTPTPHKSIDPSVRPSIPSVHWFVSSFIHSTPIQLLHRNLLA